VDLESGWGNVFAFADGTTAWSAEACPFLERETALSARGRFRSQTCRMDGPCDMLEMIKGVSLFNPEQFGDLSQVKALSFEGLCNFFPHCRHVLSFNGKVFGLCHRRWQFEPGS
jgi:hypothetical protein